MGCSPTSGPSAKAAHQVNDKRNHKDQTKCAAAKEGASNIKSAAAEQEKQNE